jgi:CheY-like chemotaxis protein
LKYGKEYGNAIAMQLAREKRALHSLVSRWQGLPPHERERVEAELAEILLYLIRAANRFGIDLVAVTSRRIAQDAEHQPRAVASVKPLAAAGTAATDQPPRILIVEDERIVAADLQEALNGMGYDAYAIASSGAEAMAIARKNRPDITLMDIRINGEVDGIEVATRLRREFHTAVVFVTALADDTTVQRAKHSDPYAYLVKPVSVSALRATIELTAHRQRRSAESLRA